jgi:hypothetical protein
MAFSPLWGETTWHWRKWQEAEDRLHAEAILCTLEMPHMEPKTSLCCLCQLQGAPILGSAESWQAQSQQVYTTPLCLRSHLIGQITDEGAQAEEKRRATQVGRIRECFMTGAGSECILKTDGMGHMPGLLKNKFSSHRVSMLESPASSHPSIPSSQDPSLSRLHPLRPSVKEALLWLLKTSTQTHFQTVYPLRTRGTVP